MTIKAPSLEQLIDSYLICCMTEGKSPKTIEFYSNTLKRFSRFLKGHRLIKPVDGIGTMEARKFVFHLQNNVIRWEDTPYIHDDRRLSPFSIQGYVRSIKAFWSWLYNEEFIEDNPLKKVKVPDVPRPLISTFTPDQVKQLLKSIPRNIHKEYRDSAIIVLIYGIGLRISEVVGLKSENVNFNTGNIKVLGKGAKERNLYMTPTVFKAMFKYKDRWRPKISSEYFFVTDDGKQLSRFNFEHRMKNYAEVTKITQLIQTGPA